jgi:glycosyltransferase involved in cell wall biosynthesis
LKPPIVSICIPAFERPDMFRRSLQSVLAQTFDDYEIIITDDSSNDSIKSSVQEFLPDERIKYIKNRDHKGSPENWNESIRHARGEYIKVLHHDDWFKDKESLGALMCLVDKNSDAALWFCACDACNPDGTFSYSHTPTAAQLKTLSRNPDCLFGNNFIGSPSVTVFRKSCGLTFDPELQWAVDVDFYIRTLRNSPGFAYCERPLVCITAGDKAQVSARCLDNKRIEIQEWFHLYRKLEKRDIFQSSFLPFLWQLIRKYDIRSSRDLVECGIKAPLPVIISFLLLTNRLLGFQAAKG